MAKITQVTGGEQSEKYQGVPVGTVTGYMWKCLGCDSHHVFYIAGKHHCFWQFDGNMEKPTFSPSLVCRWEHGEARIPKVCHVFVKNGMVEYLTDCTHHLAGKTIELPEMEN
jgi:hypothetical protein